MAGVALERSGVQVPADDAARPPVHDDEVEHLAVGERPDGAAIDLPHHRLVGAEQKLLPGLASRVERARDLRAAERSVVEQAAVLARERHALRDALVDDVDAQLREPVHVRFARAIVSALDRVVEEPLNAVAVVLVVLGRVDAALRGNAVGPSRAVLNAEAEDVVAELAERRRRGGASESRAHDDHRVLAPVRRVDQLRFEPVTVPFVGAAVRWGSWRRVS